MQKLKKLQTKECPDCHNILPVYEGFITWCDRCGWNVNPLQPEKPRNVFESIYAKLGQNQSRNLLEQQVRSEALKPTFSLSKLLAFVLAAVIHGITLIFAVGGVGLLILGWPNLFAMIGGLTCLGIAWILRPRLSKLPNTILGREDYPTLYRFVDTIANSLQSEEVSGIDVNEHFTAAFGQFGW
jgi:hypothetical protein